MLTSQTQLTFSVTGYRGTGRSTLYNELRVNAPKRFPGVPFAFLGNPFADLPNPLLWSKAELEKPATTRLLECWARLDQVRSQALQPALKEGRIVITDGFGLDAFIYATSCVNCDADNDEAEQLHHALVDVRLKQWKIRPPEYLLVHADADLMDEAMCRAAPSVRRIHEAERLKLITHQERMIERYFDPTHGQNPPLYLTLAADSGPDEMCEQALDRIGRRLNELALAA